jgi:hypothetical protein
MHGGKVSSSANELAIQSRHDIIDVKNAYFCIYVNVCLVRAHLSL